ncbi:MAG: F420-dependent NADP oxidoreductase [Oscillospiraceae bacterium]|nr:F420-dependent NADP oxidoreductase [Oscillospiraceae bacterium]
MKIGFIGAGKVGFALGKHFRATSADVSDVGFYSLNPDSAKQAAEFVGGNSFSSLEQITAESDVLFLTVPDGAIKSVWDSLKNFALNDKLICHCSGALSSDIFDTIDQKGGFGYSVHPFFAISSKTTSYQDIPKALFTVEGSVERLETLKNLIEQTGSRVHIIQKEFKIKYHAAAVFLSNHISATAYTGCELLRECGFDDEMLMTALNTLFIEHCRAIAKRGIIKTLTGPVERNDTQTITKHIDNLREPARELYIALSRQLVKIAKEKHPEREDMYETNYSDF